MNVPALRPLFLIGMLLTTGLFYGCVIPFPYSLPSYRCCRDNLDSEAIKLIEPGRTSRREVLLLLGEPDRAWLSEMRFTYTNEEVAESLRLGAIMLLGFQSETIKSREKRRYVGRRIYIEFDENGVVTDRNFQRYERSQDVIQPLGHVLPGGEDWIVIIR